MTKPRAKKRPPENVGPRGAKDSDVFPGAIGRFAASLADSFPHVWKPPGRLAEAANRHPCQSGRLRGPQQIATLWQLPVQTRPQGSKLSVVPVPQRCLALKRAGE